MLAPFDLRFLGLERAIGVYLVETDDGPALFDCGPATTLPRLEECLRERGLALTDLRHLLLSHIHFDHAGAAGTILRRHPELTVWVSEVGAPHLVDPSRLESSARRLFGADFDRFWGELVPVPERNIRLAAGDAVGWDAFPTPGHASHHVSYLRDGVLLAGDACGIRLQPERYILPPTPPPDIDLEAWHASIDEIERRAPERLALIHFGVETDVPDHLSTVPRGARPLGRLGPRRARRRPSSSPVRGARRPRRGRARRDGHPRPVVARASPLLGQARGARGRRLGAKRPGESGRL